VSVAAQSNLHVDEQFIMDSTALVNAYCLTYESTDDSKHIAENTKENYIQSSLP
jgi:hypothetical protein